MPYHLATPQRWGFLIGWGGRIRTYEMIESKSIALPLGYTPILSFKICGVEGGSRTHDLKIHNLAL